MANGQSGLGNKRRLRGDAALHVLIPAVWKRRDGSGAPRIVPPRLRRFLGIADRARRAVTAAACRDIVTDATPDAVGMVLAHPSGATAVLAVRDAQSAHRECRRFLTMVHHCDTQFQRRAKAIAPPSLCKVPARQDRRTRPSRRILAPLSGRTRRALHRRGLPISLIGNQTYAHHPTCTI